MEHQRYEAYQRLKLREHEDRCLRCGSCCGVKDNDPCLHLRRHRDGTYHCDIYAERFGLRETQSGTTIRCVPIRNMLHKTWLGRSSCAYIKYASRNAFPDLHTIDTHLVIDKTSAREYT